ncbi:MAG: SPW repeat protein [Alicyclobacillus sp.]|nr:SPW repeat protein [Alicyclobacillus sp.]
MKWRNGLNALMGLWFIVSPWILGISSDEKVVWTSVIIGAIQLVCAVWSAAQEEPAGVRHWQNWVTLVTGLWFIVQPFALSLTNEQAELWTSLILGAVTAVLSLWMLGADRWFSAREESGDHRGSAGPKATAS